MSGIVKVKGGKAERIAEGQHLVCFAGGMIGIASQIFGLDDLATARKLAEGCTWAYESSPSGIMAEVFSVVPCIGNCR